MVTHSEGKDQDGKAVKIDARFKRIDTTSTPEDFREFGKLMVGRWSSDITLITGYFVRDHNIAILVNTLELQPAVASERSIA